MVAWTGIEHFRQGRFDPPPPAKEPEDIVVCLNLEVKYITVFVFCFFLTILDSSFFCPEVTQFLS